MSRRQQRDVDRRESARRSREQAARAYRDAEDLRWVLSKPQGRRFVVRLMEMSGFYGRLAVGTPGETGYAVGRRSLGVDIRTICAQVSREALQLGEAEHGTQPDIPAEPEDDE